MKYKIEDMAVKATNADIIKLYEEIKAGDIFGERTSILSYLPWGDVRQYLKEDVTEEEWKGPKGDTDLRESFEHYRDWWREKIDNERGISVHRGKEQFALRMFLAGCPEWRGLWEMDGGWYQRDAYRFAAELFGFPAAGEDDDE